MGISDVVRRRVDRYGNVGPWLKPRRVTRESSLVIESLDGKSTLWQARDIFREIDPVYKDLDIFSRPTEQMGAFIYDLSYPKISSDIIGTTDDIASYCYTQAQIRRFCVKYPEIISNEEDWTLFPLESQGEHYLTLVYTHDGLSLGLFHLGRYQIWLAGKKVQVIMPIESELQGGVS